MKGDVKGCVPVSGEWVAVYAREGKLRRRRGRVVVTNADFGTEPVLFWLWAEHTTPRGDVAEFVGMVSLGPNVIAADDPYLLGYARKGENLVRKFGRMLKTLKAEERAGGYPEAKRESLADLIRKATPTPCPACDKGFAPDGSVCDVCGGAGVLPGGAADGGPAIVVDDKTNPLN